MKKGPWGTGTAWADAARSMKPGDSILVKTKNEARCMRLALKSKKKDYCQRSREGGYRIWCLGSSDGTGKSVTK